MLNLTQLIALLTLARTYVREHIIHPVSDPLKLIGDLFTDQLSKVGVRGPDDGKLNVPKRNESARFEEQLVSSFRSLYHQLFAKSLSIVSDLSGAIDAIAQDIKQSDYYKECSRLVADLYSKIEIKDSIIDSLRSSIQSIHTSFNLEKSKCNRPTGQTNGWPLFIKKPWLLWFVIMLFGLFEFEFIRFFLEQMNLDRYAVIIVALSITVVVAFVCHFLGQLLRRANKPLKAQIFQYVLLLLVIVIAFTGSILRWHAVQSADQSSDGMFDFNSTSNIVETVSSIDYSAALQDASFWIFFAINFAMLLIGTLVSYFAHDTHSSFEHSWKEVHVKVPALEAKILIAKSEKSALIDEAKIRVAGNSHLLTDEVKERVTQYEEALGLYNQIVTDINNGQTIVEDKVRIISSEYRDLNLKNRKDGGDGIFTSPLHFELDRIDPRENNILKFFKS